MGVGDVRLQPECGLAMAQSGDRTATVVYKGPLADVQTFAAGLASGTLITGYGYVLSWTLAGGPGPTAVLSVLVAVQSAEEHTSNAALSDTWSLACARNEVPVERYCGVSEGATPWLYDLQRWRQETDRDLYLAYKYKDAETGVEVPLSAKTTALAVKVREGKESVLRHYPVAVRTRTYSREPDCGVNLDTIEAPTKFAAKAAAWLKVQDDASQGPDGRWTRVEAWMGAAAWDANFYGTGESRWVFGDGGTPPS